MIAIYAGQLVRLVCVALCIAILIACAGVVSARASTDSAQWSLYDETESGVHAPPMGTYIDDSGTDSAVDAD
jgi:hypothetical protein